MLRTIASFAVAAALSLAAFVLGPIRDRLPNLPWPPPATLPDPGPTPSAPALPSKGETGDLLRLGAALAGTHLLQVHGGREGGADTLVVDIDAARLSEPIHQALDLALVIDRSGSMAGPKLEAAKNAARTLVDRARSTDRFSLISYGSTVSVHARSVSATPQGKRQLLHAIDGIEDFGGTYISGALKTAALTLENASAGGDRARLRRIILLSDGEANEGVTSSEGLTRIAKRLGTKGIAISTVGFGTEFNEDLMLAMADATGGRYAYVRGPADLSKALTREFSAAEAVLARELTLTLDPAPGVTITKIFGYQAFQDTSGRWILRLRDLESGGHLRVVAALKAPVERAGPRSILEVFLAARPASQAVAALAPNFAERLQLGQTVSPDPERVTQGEDRAVTIASRTAEAGEVLDLASRHFARGEQAEASRVMNLRLGGLIRRNSQGGASYDPALDQRLRALKTDLSFSGTSVGSAAGRDLVKRAKAESLELSR